MCVRTVKTGAPGAIPTRDLPLRRRTLYAAELREHKRKQQFRCVALCPTFYIKIATSKTLGILFIKYFYE